MTTSTFEARRVAVRPLAFPSEHGGWGLVLEPVVLALIVSPSVAGALIATGVVGIFLMRHPLKLAMQDWMRGRRYPRTGVSELLAVTYGGVACIAFAFAWWLAGPQPFIILAIALPLGLVQFAFDVRNRGRLLLPELCGAALPAAFAAAIVTRSLAITIAILVLARSIPAVLYVRSVLRGESRTVMIVAHIAAIVAAFAVAPPLAGIAMILLLVRALLPSHVPARTIGFREIGMGLVTVALIAISLA